MSKRATTLELSLPPRPDDVPAYRWLYDALRSAILGGHFRPGAKIPSSREIADRHGLARGTVVHALDLLMAEGYLEGRRGSGTVVANSLPDDFLETGGTSATRRHTGLAGVRATSDYARRLAPFPEPGPRPIRAFRADLQAVDLFPVTLWAQLAGRRLRRASASDLRSSDPLGDPALREVVAEYLNLSRGVRCGAEQVAIVSGVQEALDLVTRLLVDPGDPVVIEDPGYTGATVLFEAAGALIEPVPVDDEGLEVEALPNAGARLVYITPAHQYPLGITMSLSRRLELLEWARRTGTRVFEDDYDSEYRYCGRPVPAVQGLDECGSVLFAGSFNKVLFPALRLGYLVLPHDLIDRVAAARSIGCRYPPLFEQRVLLDFMAEGHFGRHLRRMREVYAERRAALVEGARSRLGGLLELTGVEAGLQTSGRLAPGIDAAAVAAAAAAREVEAVPLARYYHRAVPIEGLQLGFAAVDRREIERGVRELAVVLESHAPAG